MLARGDVALVIPTQGLGEPVRPPCYAEAGPPPVDRPIFIAMSLAIRLLGTSASRPTVERNVASLAVVREGETLLFDCGEGTQRQMMRYGVSFGLADIFFTHFHADHVIGVIGLMRTMSLQGRTDPLRLWGPRGAARMLKRAEDFGMDRLSFPLEITELEPGQSVARQDYAIVPFPVDHRGARAVGYAVVEEERKGRFNPDLARELGIPEGPLWGEIHRGRSVTLDDGRTIEPSVLVGAARPGRTVVLTGDTRPCAATLEAARGADVLVHEATFGDEEAVRAVETGHSTAREAATIAASAGVGTLLLVHFSARYSRDASDLGNEAREVFERTLVGKDGMELEIPYRSDALTV
jgi:ribonuclease Z